jgi:hypothetical protein
MKRAMTTCETATIERSSAFNSALNGRCSCPTTAVPLIKESFYGSLGRSSCQLHGSHRRRQSRENDCTSTGGHPVFIAGDQPVTEDQVRNKLQSEGWVRTMHVGRYIQATGVQNGQAQKVTVDSDTGRFAARRTMTTMVELNSSRLGNVKFDTIGRR